MKEPIKNQSWILLLALFICADQGNSDDPMPDDPSRAILFFGNSLTAGYGLDKKAAFPALIQEKIDRMSWPYIVVNAGLSGETSAGGLRRIDWMLKKQFELIVIELGGNDGLRGVPLEETRKNLNAIVDRIIERGPQVKIVIAGMQLPPNLGSDYTGAFKSIYPNLAKKYNTPLIPFLLKGVGGDPNLNLPDGIHPNAKGHKIVAETVWATLKPILQSIQEAQAEPPPEGIKAAVERVAFGSCLRQDRPQPVWKSVLETAPDVFVFLGDNIYANTTDPEVMRRKYGLLNGQAGFRTLRNRCRILATWDDNDYGSNDGGANYPMRGLSQRIFLDFWRWSEGWSHPGVYQSRILGPPGQEVQFILLDTRYFRSNLVGESGLYRPNAEPDATVLGDLQWKWLEEELRKPAEVRIIASSIQVIPTEHRWEKWANFPRERERLFGLIASTGANGVVFLSGDRHLAEISRLTTGVPYTLYEVTSSPLNQKGGGSSAEPNRFRISQSNYREGNFGLITIDWDRRVLKLAILNEGGAEVFSQRVPLIH